MLSHVRYIISGKRVFLYNRYTVLITFLYIMVDRFFFAISIMLMIYRELSKSFNSQKSMFVLFFHSNIKSNRRNSKCASIYPQSLKQKMQKIKTKPVHQVHSHLVMILA
jgi:hypothetical protein